MPEFEDLDPFEKEMRDLVTEVPVVDPNKTATNWVGVVTAVGSFVVLLAKAFEVPFTEADLEIIMGAAGVLVGVFMWIKNRWFTAEATLPTARKKGLKLAMRYKED